MVTSRLQLELTLPIVTVQNLDEAISFVNARPKPLAAYLFTKAKAVRERVIRDVPAGGMVVNHLIFHFATHKLPFGHHGGNHPVRHLDSGAVEIVAAPPLPDPAPDVAIESRVVLAPWEVYLQQLKA